MVKEDPLEYTMSRLVDVLPASLETFHLHHARWASMDYEYSVDHGDAVENIFAGFSRLKQVRLPTLRCIIIEGEDRLSQETKAECRRLDVSCLAIDQTVRVMKLQCITNSILTEPIL